MPTAMNEVSRGLSWLMTTLTGDATLTASLPGGVWRDMAPAGSATPFCVVSLQSATDVIGAGGYRQMVNCLFQINLAAPASQYPTLVTASDRLDVLLGRASGQTSDAYILSCTREQTIELPRLEDGVLWSTRRTLQRILISSL